MAHPTQRKVGANLEESKSTHHHARVMEYSFSARIGCVHIAREVFGG